MSKGLFQKFKFRVAEVGPNTKPWHMFEAGYSHLKNSHGSKTTTLVRSSKLVFFWQHFYPLLRFAKVRALEITPCGKTTNFAGS